MPGRGGRRTGTPGKSYQNRSDLTSSRVATGQPYGQAATQQRSLQQIPLPQGGGPPSTPGSGETPGSAGQTTLGLQPSVLPGQLGPLHGPSQRPDEPLTAGMPTGPGAGPEALRPPDPLANVAAVLNALGDTADPDTKTLRSWVNTTLHNQGAA